MRGVNQHKNGTRLVNDSQWTLPASYHCRFIGIMVIVYGIGVIPCEWKCPPSQHGLWSITGQGNTYQCWGWNSGKKGIKPTPNQLGNPTWSLCKLQSVQEIKVNMLLTQWSRQQRCKQMKRLVHILPHIICDQNITNATWNKNKGLPGIGGIATLLKQLFEEKAVEEMHLLDHFRAHGCLQILQVHIDDSVCTKQEFLWKHSEISKQRLDPLNILDA